MKDVEGSTAEKAAGHPRCLHFAPIYILRSAKIGHKSRPWRVTYRLQRGHDNVCLTRSCASDLARSSSAATPLVAAPCGSQIDAAWRAARPTCTLLGASPTRRPQVVRVPQVTRERFGWAVGAEAWREMWVSLAPPGRGCVALDAEADRLRRLRPQRDEGGRQLPLSWEEAT